MLRAVKDATGEDTAMLMGQPNTEGKSPQDLLEETRNRGQGIAQPLPGPGIGSSRGRGPPVGA